MTCNVIVISFTKNTGLTLMLENVFHRITHHQLKLSYFIQIVVEKHTFHLCRKKMFSVCICICSHAHFFQGSRNRYKDISDSTSLIIL